MTRRLTPALAVALLGACAPHPYRSPDMQGVPEPAPADVASVLFLAGDGGEALVDGYPVLHRLRWDVERWSAALAEQSAVAVLFLGDNVYPSGVRDPGTEDFARDTSYLAAQAWTVEGAEARRYGTRAVFLAGNHDWGNRTGPVGLARLRNQEDVIQAWAEAGRAVSLQPKAGSPGPVVMEVGPAVVPLLDTNWWLQSTDREAKARAIEELQEVLLAARGRPVIVAAHHPLFSAGDHGGRHGLDPMSLLGRAGALVQDLNSTPYREMRDEMSGVFAQSDRPLAWAAGHDHSLQVLRTAGPGRPGWTLVSGAASKLTAVADIEELEWGGTEPGYMRLLFLNDGSVLLFVEAAPATAQRCVGVQEARPCIERGVRAYRTVYSARLR